MVPDKFTTNLPIKIKRKKKREACARVLFLFLSTFLSLSRKNTPGKSAHCETGRSSRAERSFGERSTTIQKPPSEKFFQPAAPVNTATVFLQLFKHPLPRIVPFPLSSFLACSPPHTRPGTHNASSNPAEFILGRYSRCSPTIFNYVRGVVRVFHAPNNLFDSLACRKTVGGVIKRRAGADLIAVATRRGTRTDAIGRDRFEIDYSSPSLLLCRVAYINILRRGTRAISRRNIISLLLLLSQKFVE